MSFTLAITSCNRHSLLRRTLESWVACVSQNPIQTIILEDGPTPKPAWLDTFSPRLGKIKWINNASRMGQSYSIDRLYSEISTEYIFWCEDDWEFHEGNFLSRSFQILRDHPKVSMVALRSDWNHPVELSVQHNVSGGTESLRIAEPYWGGVWGGTCWNPGLRRLSDFKRFGSYGRHVGYGVHGLGHEKDWSKLHLDLGFRIAVLPSHCRHIGGGCSRAIEPLENHVPRILVAIPACRSFDYGRWESAQSPHYKSHNEPYGTDIHISGENPRIQAVRETWWKDINPFAPNVEAKFFYGNEGADANEPDEVNLPCRDDYASLPTKTREICKYALANGFDFVFKCDDDTIVYVDELVREILDYRCDYGGCEHAGVATGGPGYILSRRAMKVVVDSGDQAHWAEDCSVSKALGLANIQVTHLPGHTPGYAAHWIWPNGFNPARLTVGMVSGHAVQPDIMRQWYAFKELNTGHPG